MTGHFGPMVGAAVAELQQLIGEEPRLAPRIGPITELLARIAADVDTGVADRLRAARQIEGLLRRARELLPAADAEALDRTLAAVAPTGADAFTTPSAEAACSCLKRALIDVHARLEAAGGSGAERALLDDVWAFCQADVAHAGRMETNLW